jgi:hypothetical protein
MQTHEQILETSHLQNYPLEYPVACDPLEDAPMTIQIAGFCKDAIVVAGDTQCTNINSGFRTSTNRTKFIKDEAAGLFVATSGDDALSNSAAREAIKGISGECQLLELDKKYDDCFRARYGDVTPGSNPIKAELLILNTSTRMVLHSRIRYRSDSNPYSEGKVYAGDPENAAKFFVERFYDPQMSTDSLKRLLAIAIYQARKLNTAFISGLEMFVCDRNTGRVTEEKNVAALVEMAASADAMISETITSGLCRPK